MARCTALLLLALALTASSALAAPTMAALTPTQLLAEQRTAQQQQAYQHAAAQANNAWTYARRLDPPCFVPDSYYPLQTCKVSTSVAE